MIPLKYTEAVRGILVHLEQTQLSQIERAAAIITDSLIDGGALFCGEVGHNNQDDFINRAGGPAALQRFMFSFNIDAPVAECRANRPRPESAGVDLESMRFAARASELRAGDVLVLGSVSGRNKRPVELAMAVREAGAKVIGITSLDYTFHVESAHPSGKKLCDVVDVVIDNGAPYGDAAVDIAGYDFKMPPVCGVSATLSSGCFGPGDGKNG